MTDILITTNLTDSQTNKTLKYTGSTNNGTTNLLELKDSDSNIVFSVNSNGVTTDTNPKLVNRLIVGTQGHYTTLKEAVDYLNVNATAPTEILLDGGTHLVTDTVTINNAYIIAVRGQSSGGCILAASTGLTNKPMVIINTECYFDKIQLNATTLASYGTLSTENCFNITGSVYFDFQNAVITGFYHHIYLTGTSSSMFIFNSVFNSPVNCSMCINSTGATSIDIETNSFINCPISLHLLKSSDGNFDFINNILDAPSASTQIVYVPDAGNFIPHVHSTITLNKWNSTGTFQTGFDFTRSDGRDANIFFNSNIGYENKNPHRYIEVLDNTTLTTITTANVWTKANWDAIDIIYTCKLYSPSINKVVHQPINPSDLTFQTSLSVETDTGAPNEFSACIIKNATINANNELVTGTPVGVIRTRLESNDNPYNVNILAYFSNVQTTDYFEIFVMQDNNDNLRITRLTSKITS